jgi:hypothetical protein
METPFSNDWATTFENKVEILSELYSNYKDDEQFAQFMTYNDIGLPLAYLISSRLATATLDGEKYIDESFDMFATGLNLDRDVDYFSLTHINDWLGKNETEEVTE